MNNRPVEPIDGTFPVHGRAELRVMVKSGDGGRRKKRRRVQPHERVLIATVSGRKDWKDRIEEWAKHDHRTVTSFMLKAALDLCDRLEIIEAKKESILNTARQIK